LLTAVNEGTRPIAPYVQKISAIPAESDPATQFAGLAALQSLATARPLDAARRAHGGGLRRWVSRIWAQRFRLAAGLFLVAIAPAWLGSLEQQSKSDGFGTETAVVSWVSEHVPAGDIVVCDAYPWLDIELHTHATPLYLWQVDTDPQVTRTELPKGYRSISYLVLAPGSPLTFSALPGRPTLQQAISHSAVVRRFGGIVIYKVRGALSGLSGLRPEG
jgi:hypothetical protein